MSVQKVLNIFLKIGMYIYLITGPQRRPRTLFDPKGKTQQNTYNDASVKLICGTGGNNVLSQ